MPGSLKCFIWFDCTTALLNSSKKRFLTAPYKQYIFFTLDGCCLFLMPVNVIFYFIFVLLSEYYKEGFVLLVEHLPCSQEQPSAEIGKSYLPYLKAVSEYLLYTGKEDCVHCYCIFTTLPSCIVLWCYANPFHFGQVREDLPHHPSGSSRSSRRSEKWSVTYLSLAINQILLHSCCVMTSLLLLLPHCVRFLLHTFETRLSIPRVSHSCWIPEAHFKFEFGIFRDLFQSVPMHFLSIFSRKIPQHFSFQKLL